MIDRPVRPVTLASCRLPFPVIIGTQENPTEVAASEAAMAAVALAVAQSAKANVTCHRERPSVVRQCRVGNHRRGAGWSTVVAPASMEEEREMR
jgi:hypothetical protein